jgi:hypothetical protein
VVKGFSSSLPACPGQGIKPKNKKGSTSAFSALNGYGMPAAANAQDAMLRFAALKKRNLRLWRV